MGKKKKVPKKNNPWVTHDDLKKRLHDRTELKRDIYLKKDKKGEYATAVFKIKDMKNIGKLSKRKYLQNFQEELEKHTNKTWTQDKKNLLKFHYRLPKIPKDALEYRVPRDPEYTMEFVKKHFSKRPRYGCYLTHNKGSPYSINFTDASTQKGCIEKLKQNVASMRIRGVPPISYKNTHFLTNLPHKTIFQIIGCPPGYTLYDKKHCVNGKRHSLKNKNVKKKKCSSNARFIYGECIPKWLILVDGEWVHKRPAPPEGYIPFKEHAPPGKHVCPNCGTLEPGYEYGNRIGKVTECRNLQINN